MKPPYVIGSVPGLLGHAIAYRWRSLPRVRRHRASECVYVNGHTYSKSKDQPGKVANPARGQLTEKKEYFPVPVRA